MKKQYCFTPKQCVAGAGSATPLREEDFRATKQIKFVAKQCCNFKKQCCFAINQCCFAIKQCIAVTDRIVLATRKTVAVTWITGGVKALPVSVAKKSINDALLVMSETEFIFIAGKQTCSIQATFGLFSCRARLQKILCGRGFPALAFVKF